MRLSKLRTSSGVLLAVRRDGHFDSLGLISHNMPRQLVYVESSQHAALLPAKKNIACAITSPKLARLVPKWMGLAVSKDPKRAFYETHNYLAKHTAFYGKSFTTEIAADARIHKTAFIEEKNVRIGRRCEVGSNVSVLEGSILEDDVTLRAGVVVGSEGFQFMRFGQEVLPIVHAGGVLIHRGVELQANCSVSKSVFGGFTEIGEYSKLDNLVHVAHNCKIGNRCLIAACAMIAGSARIGDDVWIGPSASISSEITVGDGASVTLGSVVTKDVPPGKRVTGNFAIDHEKFISFLKKIS